MAAVSLLTAASRRSRVILVIRGGPYRRTRPEAPRRTQGGPGGDLPKLADLAEHWDKIPRRKNPDGQYANQCRLRLKRFATWAAEHQPDATEFVAVKPETAKAFMEAEAKREVSPKTWNDMLKLLRATFKHLHLYLSDGSNPFHGLVTKASETVNREPWSRS